MTAREAINWLAPETSPKLIKEAEDRGENPVEHINKAIKVAIAALEKTTPKRYKMDIDTAVCPVCGAQVEQQHMNGELLIHEFFTWCQNCGQAIDWSERSEA